MNRVGTEVTVAVAQVALTLGDVRRNVATCRARLAEAADSGASLLVLPECALTGYLFDSASEVRRVALELDGPEIGSLVSDCRKLSIHCVVGFLEKHDGSVFNSAVLLSPDGVSGVYRKAHLPCIGADRFVAPGLAAAPPVFSTSFGRVGLGICFDLRFPEWFRVLALSGADIIALPTNWPARQPAIVAEDFPRVRACENRVFVLVADRWDSESGVSFLGHSKIVGPDGTVLAEQATGEALLVQVIDLAQARTKTVVYESGVYEVALFDARRAELYGSIASVNASAPEPKEERSAN